MPDSNPTGAPATGATGQNPGATGPTSQGPNDPIQPPATGAPTQTPATGQGTDGPTTEERLSNMEAAMRRMGEERDKARQELEAEKRKGLSEDERKRLEELDRRDKDRDARERTLILRYEVASRAAKLGIQDPEVAVLLLERSGDIKVEDGQVSGVDDALKALIKDKPYLVRPVGGNPGGQDAGASAGPAGGASGGMNERIRRAAGRG